MASRAKVAASDISARCERVAAKRGVGPMRGQGRPVMAGEATQILGTGPGTATVVVSRVRVHSNMIRTSRMDADALAKSHGRPVGKPPRRPVGRAPAR